jgi:hypothetical protein
MQCLGPFLFTFHIPWPEHFETMLLRINSFFNFNIMDLLTFASDIGCSVPTNFFAGFMVHMMILPALLACIGVAWLAARMRIWAGNSFLKHKAKPHFNTFTITARAKQTLNFFVFLLYPGARLRGVLAVDLQPLTMHLFAGLCAKMFQMFKCSTIGDHEHLVADVSERCWEGLHQKYCWSVWFLFFPAYVIGIPLGTFVILYRRRHDIADDRLNPVLMMEVGSVVCSQCALPPSGALLSSGRVR